MLSGRTYPDGYKSKTIDASIFFCVFLEKQMMSIVVEHNGEKVAFWSWQMLDSKVLPDLSLYYPAEHVDNIMPVMESKSILMREGQSTLTIGRSANFRRDGAISG